ncbi:MAG: acyl-CoA dehydrogenase [Alphaproteobacteria bacterium]|nr:acyl-CoA dehydrogenase [Alphaproteobacteria bacterium]
MTGYAAPVQDMRFALEEVAGLAELAGLPGWDQAEPDLIASVLEEAGKLARDVIAPINRSGDIEGARLENGIVRMPRGFREAYAQFIAGGWNGLPFAEDIGGQNLPWAVSCAVQEIWQAANLSFGQYPLLTQGAIEALSRHGSPEQKKLYLSKMVAGVWNGTMNLTEPQAGTDLGALRTRAVRADGHYRITGQKIFITNGDTDLTENTIHLVLARLPDAPAGVKGISLFVVPKLMVEADGRMGSRNDLRVVSLEHKLGIRASPTCVMSYGDNGGAVGTLVGEEGRGLEYMFTMMNNARLSVGIQGVAMGERAYQQARAYARSRVQSRELGSRDVAPAAIIRHPDVRRMLMTMKAQTEASRALAYYAASALDRAKALPDAAGRARAQATADLLIPVVKAWSTDLGFEIASTGVQIHGGMGFIEETGAAQHLRDARITMIYEGTSGIQANDLLGRKLMRDKGVAAAGAIAQFRTTADRLATGPGDDLATIRRHLIAGIDTLERATAWLIQTWGDDVRRASAGATPYLRMMGIVAGGWVMAISALAATERLKRRNGDAAFLEAKLITARFYAEHILSQANALLTPIMEGGGTVMALDEDQF